MSDAELKGSFICACCKKNPKAIAHTDFSTRPFDAPIPAGKRTWAIMAFCSTCLMRFVYHAWTDYAYARKLPLVTLEKAVSFFDSNQRLLD